MTWLKAQAKTLPFWAVVFLLVAAIPAYSALGGIGSTVMIVLAAIALFKRKSPKAKHSAGAAALALVIALTGFGIASANSEVSTSPSATAPSKPSSAPDKLSSAPSSPPSATSSPTASPSSSPTPTPSQTPAPAKTSPSPTQPAAAPGTALAAAQQLTVKGRAPKTGYSRDMFGQRWKDIDRNGCDQRNDVLRRDLTGYTVKAGTNGCVVMTGTLNDPYSAETIAFQRGQDTSTAVQIDHVVALSDAWQKGAQQWSGEKREQFANDFLNLLAVKGAVNAAKSDSDAASWLPPNKSYRCSFAARQVSVKHKYGLWATAAEQEALVRILSSCPEQPMLTSGQIARDVSAPVAPEPTASTAPIVPAVPQQPAVTQQPAPQQNTDVYYKNCTAVWDAIGRPIHRGEPGYHSRLDRDGDGVGCESRPR